MLKQSAFVATGLLTIWLANTASAQWFHSQVRSDYQQPTVYSPEDPNYRSWLFLEHTGHSGRFYNCDGEEDKRFSPYIYWSTIDNRECIRPWGQVLRCDLKEVFARVRSGACCGDETCQCAECQSIMESTHAPAASYSAGHSAATRSSLATSEPRQNSAVGLPRVSQRVSEASRGSSTQTPSIADLPNYRSRQSTLKKR